MSAAPPTAVEPARLPGRLVVAILLVFGLSLAFGARWWHTQIERRPVEFWGDRAIRSILGAEAGEVLVFTEMPSAAVVASSAASTGPAGTGGVVASEGTRNGPPSTEGDGSRVGQAIGTHEKVSREEPATASEGGPAGDSALRIDGADRGVARIVPIPQDSSFVHLRRILLSDFCFQWTTPVPPGPANWRFALRLSGERGGLVVLFDPTQRRIRALDGSREAIVSPAAFEPFAALVAPPKPGSATGSTRETGTNPSGER